MDGGLGSHPIIQRRWEERLGLLWFQGDGRWGDVGLGKWHHAGTRVCSLVAEPWTLKKIKGGCNLGASKRRPWGTPELSALKDRAGIWELGTLPGLSKPQPPSSLGVAPLPDSPCWDWFRFMLSR